MLEVVFPFISAILFTMLLTPVSIRVANRLGAIDSPDERKVHVNITPRMGGLSFLVALICIPPTFLELTSGTIGFLLGLAVVGITGIADDIYQISPKIKFAGVILGASLFLLLSNASIDNLGDLFGLGAIELGWMAFPVTLFAVVGFVNAVNLCDGLDGLAAGITLIVSSVLVAFSLAIGDPGLLHLSVVLTGCMIGFLYFNSHPAKIFMGDTGSLVLGYCLAAISLMLLSVDSNNIMLPVSLGILMGLPLVDTLYVMTRRVLHGISPFLPDKTHYHHRLMALGLSHSAAVSVLYTLMIFYGCIALLFSDLPDWQQSLVLLMIVIASYLPIALMERYRISFNIKHQVDRPEPGYRYQFTHILGQSIPVVTWVIPLLLLVPMFTVEISQTDVWLLVAFIVLIMVLYPWKETHDVSWTHGILYLLVFSIILFIDTSAAQWASDYMLLATTLLGVWVVLKLWFKRNYRVFLTSGLEMLLLLFSWVIPLMLEELHLLPEAIEANLYLLCVQAIVFLIAVKIVIRRQPRRNIQLLCSLIALLAVAII